MKIHTSNFAILTTSNQYVFTAFSLRFSVEMIYDLKAVIEKFRLHKKLSGNFSDVGGQKSDGRTNNGNKNGV